MQKSAKSRREKTRSLAISAVMLALAFGLSYVKIWQMPLGGAVTLLSMLPLCIVSLREGLLWGLGTAFCYSWLQVLQGGVFGWGLTPGILIASLLLDYILAFTVIGLAGLFRRRGLPGILAGIALALLLRFGCHFVSGVYLWTHLESFSFLGQEFTASPYLFSLVYNGQYMLPELLFTLVAAALLFSRKKLRKQILSI